jgi:tripartite ATP-independent transporter DctM subunit
MSQELVGLIGIIIMLVLIFSGMWVGLTMAFVGFVGFVYLGGLQAALANLATTSYNTVASYNFAPIPLFVLMGNLVSTTGVSSDLYNTAYKWFGQLKGGLAVATCVACAAFAAICGSSIAGAVTMGKVCLPEMKRHGYDDRLATGVVASGGTLGILIPPSIGLILYGIITENSVGKLFMAGIIPGLLLTGLFMVTVFFWTLKDAKVGPPGPKISLKEKIVSLKGTWIMGLLFLLVLGGLYLGIFTPTESGAIGAFGAIIITLLNRRITWKHLLESVKDTGMTTAKVGIMIIGAYLLMRFLAISQLPAMLAGSITELHVSPYATLVIILAFYVILGMFLDILSAVIFTVPIIYPVITGLGFDPIWFGIIMVIIQEMGLVTPPVGLNVFALGSVTDVPMTQIFKGVLPFIAAMIVCTLLLVLFPEIVLFIPSRM